MKKMQSLQGLFWSLLAIALTTMPGCSKNSPKVDQGKPKSDQAAVKKVDDHSGWWCDEHGIPEEKCSMCSEEYAKKCKVEGDWCDKHDRAKSQCFLCDPSKKEEFAKQYRLKYGKEPPPIQEETEEKPSEKK